MSHTLRHNFSCLKIAIRRKIKLFNLSNNQDPDTCPDMISLPKVNVSNSVHLDIKVKPIYD